MTRKAPQSLARQPRAPHRVLPKGGLDVSTDVSGAAGTAGPSDVLRPHRHSLLWPSGAAGVHEKGPRELAGLQPP